MPDTPEPKDYFEEGEEPEDSPNFSAPPVRENSLLEPLLDGKPAFREMELVISKATKSIYFSAWVFNPKTPLQNEDVKKSGAATWGDLFAEAAKRKCEVRILLSDFDPLVQEPLHTNAWKVYRQILKIVNHLTRADRDRLQVVISRHEATVSVGVEDHLKPMLEIEVKRLNAPTAGVDLMKLGIEPGIWQWLTMNKKKRLEIKDSSELFLSPASHHQKTCVVDEEIAFCGGLDVNYGRLDSPGHFGANAWHDIHVRAEGTVVHDVSRNFVARWNAESPVFTAFLIEANKSGLPVSLPVHKADAILPAKIAKQVVRGKSLCQMHRTVSTNAFFKTVPTTEVRDIERNYERVIGLAREFIYIENQYIRSEKLKDWILRVAEKQNTLKVIFVLPVAPEEVAGKKIDPVTNHGLYLQHKVLTELMAELKSRFGLYSMVKKTPSAKTHATDSCGSPQIYVHSKLLLVDDVYLSIGSANANPRSFQVDTEMNIGCYHPALVKAFRLRLWAELLGKPAELSSWKPERFIHEWNKIALPNSKIDPQKRAGLIVPHNPDKSPALKGVKGSFVPDEFTDFFDLETRLESDERPA